LGEEIIANTLSAAFRDPRFKPVSREELASLRFSVDILSPSEPVVDRKDLDPHRWGIIVEDGARRGVLLPDLDGIDEVDQQIDIACRKAGIPEGRSLTISRFRVARFQEEP
jgi:AMMECR1 domain-containing protein